MERLQITARDFDLTAAIDSEVREKLATLDRYYDRITSCEVTLGGVVGHHRKGGPFDVRIRLKVPNKELVADHRHDSDFSLTLRESFAAIKRQLEDYVREHRQH
jgi:putative sigma-54 modulation protein